MSKKLVHLLISLKVGLVHQSPMIRCPKSRLTKSFLSLLLSLGIVESFKTCLIYKRCFKIILTQPDLYKTDKIGDSNSVQMKMMALSMSTKSDEFLLNIYVKRKRYMKYKDLLNIKKKNNKSFIILSTSLGFLTITEAVKNRLGGLLICEILY